MGHQWACRQQVKHLLSATCGIGESIIGAKERGKGTSDSVAVGGDGGGRRHPVVQHSPLFPIILVLLQGLGSNLDLGM